MRTKHELVEALASLGELLAHNDRRFDIVVIGGGALLIRGLISRSTQDLDVIAMIDNGRWIMATKPLPEPLVAAIREVADALDLPREPDDDKDWLNAGPAMLVKLGLPPGFEDRVETQTFSHLTLRIAHRQDLITLKLWAATDPSRGSRRSVDLDDLAELSPTRDELRAAVEWCVGKDGREDFIEHEVRPALEKLGIDLCEVLDG
jgi:hypothetical protein